MTYIHPGFLAKLGRNEVFWAAFAAWVVAQTIKVAIGVVRERRFNFKWFVGSGGMPSSHSAAVVGLATGIGIRYGVDSPFFTLALAFAFVTMFDAQGVRRQSGKQAGALNRILDDLYANRGIQMEPLKSLIGHTPFEVFAGAFVGVIVVMLIL